MPLSAANSLVAPIAAAVGLGLVALLRSVRRHRRPRANTDLTQKARFRLFYWPGFPGRGEFIRLIFAECATPGTRAGQYLTSCTMSPGCGRFRKRSY